jgi:endonuclease/exonuclease/phosphatase (EEP) superfamily protein YafD
LAASGLILLGAIPAAVLSLLGFFGGWWWVFDLAAAFRVQYAVVLTLAAALLLVVRARRSALAIAVVAILNGVVVAPLWLGVPVPGAEGATLRVHFHNVHGGGDERFAEVARELASSDADVVFLSEVSARWIELFGGAELPYTIVHPLRVEDHRRLLALTRIPIDGVEAVPLVAGSRSGGIAVDLTLGGRPLRMLALHAQSPRDARSAALHDAEVTAVGEWVTAQDVPVAIVGDLNATAWSHPLRRLRRATGLRDSQHGFGLQPTWMEGAGPLMVPLDHVLHDAGVTVLDRSTGPALGSSHRSLQATLARPAESEARMR